MLKVENTVWRATIVGRTIESPGFCMLLRASPSVVGIEITQERQDAQCSTHSSNQNHKEKTSFAGQKLMEFSIWLSQAHFRLQGAEAEFPGNHGWVNPLKQHDDCSTLVMDWDCLSLITGHPVHDSQHFSLYQMLSTKSRRKFWNPSQ